MITKEDSLKDNGSFNRNFMNVHADVFNSSPFFDAKDIVQVKYEMLRAVMKDGIAVTSVAKKFGFSRKSFYQIDKAFAEGGLYALMPKKTGPKGPSKLHGEVSDYIDSYLFEHNNANAKEIAAQLEASLGIRIHPRTIERYLEKKTKPIKSK
jgi:transposase